MAADLRSRVCRDCRPETTGRGDRATLWWLPLLATVGLVITACSPGSASSAHSPGSHRTPVGWVRHAGQSWSGSHGPSVGVSIATPAAWHFNRHPAPALLSPAMLFAAGTGPVPAGGSCAPTAALKVLPANGALFVLYEVAHADFRPRPKRLHLGVLGGPFECWAVKGYIITFEDGRRDFQAQVVFGPRASPSLRAEVVRSLNTLQVDALPAS